MEAMVEKKETQMRKFPLGTAALFEHHDVRSALGATVFSASVDAKSLDCPRRVSDKKPAFVVVRASTLA
jgi:hypothetical protein